jgi:hypothetical protein
MGKDFSVCWRVRMCACVRVCMCVRVWGVCVGSWGLTAGTQREHPGPWKCQVLMWSWL